MTVVFPAFRDRVVRLSIIAGLAVGAPAASAWAKSALPVRAQEVLALRAVAKPASAGSPMPATTAAVNGIGGIDAWVVGRPVYCLTLTTDAGERALYIELKGDVSAVSTDTATIALFASACGAKETEVGLHFDDQEAGTVDAVYLATHPLGGKRGENHDDEDEEDDEAENSKAKRSSMSSK